MTTGEPSFATLGELYAWIPTWLFRAAVIFFGLIWGSFLNVVIYRVPRGMSVSSPPSHCPGCGKPVAFYDNLPVLSYLILRGRARCCGTRMSPRYPLVELLGGALSLAILEVIIFRMPEATPSVRALAVYGADFALCMGLVAATFIDAEHMFLPDAITLGGIVLGLATATLRGMPFTSSLAGAAIGFGSVWLPFIFLYKGLLGRTGMGMGDAKLLGLAGAWFGWQGAVFALFAGALQGTFYAIVLKIFGIEPKLPQAVLDDIAELERAAAAGDEEAKKALEEDPLTEDEDDAFILRWMGLRKRDDADAKEDADANASASASANASADACAKADEDANANADENAKADANASANANADAKSDANANANADAVANANVEARAGDGTEVVTHDAAERDGALPRARIPFGPFLILACLELLFAKEWIEERLAFLFGPL